MPDRTYDSNSLYLFNPDQVGQEPPIHDTYRRAIVARRLMATAPLILSRHGLPWPRDMQGGNGFGIKLLSKTGDVSVSSRILDTALTRCQRRIHFSALSRKTNSCSPFLFATTTTTAARMMCEMAPVRSRGKLCKSYHFRQLPVSLSPTETRRVLYA